MAPMRLPTEKAHGIQIMETCAALVRAGAEVELLISNRRTHIKEDAFEYYSIKDRFPITRLSAPETISYGRVGFLLHAIIFAFRAVQYARKVKPDFVYTRDPATLSICSLMGIGPLAWEVHTTHPRVPRTILRGVKAFIAITRGLAEWYVSLRAIPRADMHVAPDAVDLAAFESIGDRSLARENLRARLGLSKEANIALYAGSFGLYEWKGVDVAREAARHAPEVAWLFVGGSLDECDALKRGAAANVYTLPRVHRKDIPNLISAADVLLLPNKRGDAASERDTSPMKLFEYMASGVPVVASDVPSLREVVNDRNAFLVVPNDPILLAEKVRHVLANSGEASTRAASARADVKNYTWDKRAEGILQFLSKR